MRMGKQRCDRNCRNHTAVFIKFYLYPCPVSYFEVIYQYMRVVLPCRGSRELLMQAGGTGTERGIAYGELGRI